MKKGLIAILVAFVIVLGACGDKSVDKSADEDEQKTLLCRQT